MPKSTVMDKLCDDLSLSIFGRSRTLAQAGNGCVMCGKPATQFRDAISQREYKISGLCQQCQDKVFVEPEE